MTEMLGVLSFMLLLAGIGAIVTAIVWFITRVIKRGSIKQPLYLLGISLLVSAFSLLLIKNLDTSITDTKKVTQPKNIIDITMVENKYLRHLQDGKIKPEIKVLENGRSYITKYAVLNIQGYPIVKKITGMIIPTNDNPANMESFFLVGMAVISFCNKSDDPKSNSQFVDIFTKSLSERNFKNMDMENCRITIHPPDKKALIPSIVVKIEPK